MSIQKYSYSPGQWYSYFYAPPKSPDMLIYFNKLETEFDRLYFFLPKDQIRAKLMDFLGVPNTGGKILKSKLHKIFLHETSIQGKKRLKPKKPVLVNLAHPKAVFGGPFKFFKSKNSRKPSLAADSGFLTESTLVDDRTLAKNQRLKQNCIDISSDSDVELNKSPPKRKRLNQKRRQNGSFWYETLVSSESSKSYSVDSDDEGMPNAANKSTEVRKMTPKTLHILNISDDDQSPNKQDTSKQDENHNHIELPQIVLPLSPNASPQRSVRINYIDEYYYYNKDSACLTSAPETELRNDSLDDNDYDTGLASPFTSQMSEGTQKPNPPVEMGPQTESPVKSASTALQRCSSTVSESFTPELELLRYVGLRPRDEENLSQISASSEFVSANVVVDLRAPGAYEAIQQHCRNLWKAVNSQNLTGIPNPIRWHPGNDSVIGTMQLCDPSVPPRCEAMSGNISQLDTIVPAVPLLSDCGANHGKDNPLNTMLLADSLMPQASKARPCSNRPLDAILPGDPSIPLASSSNESPLNMVHSDPSMPQAGPSKDSPLPTMLPGDPSMPELGKASPRRNSPVNTMMSPDPSKPQASNESGVDDITFNTMGSLMPLASFRSPGKVIPLHILLPSGLPMSPQPDSSMISHNKNYTPELKKKLPFKKRLPILAAPKLQVLASNTIQDSPTPAIPRGSSVASFQIASIAVPTHKCSSTASSEMLKLPQVAMSQTSHTPHFEHLSNTCVESKICARVDLTDTAEKSISSGALNAASSRENVENSSAAANEMTHSVESTKAVTVNPLQTQAYLELKDAAEHASSWTSKGSLKEWQRQSNLAWKMSLPHITEQFFNDPDAVDAHMAMDVTSRSGITWSEPSSRVRVRNDVTCQEVEEAQERDTAEMSCSPSPRSNVGAWSPIRDLICGDLTTSEQRNQREVDPSAEKNHSRDLPFQESFQTLSITPRNETPKHDRQQDSHFLAWWQDEYTTPKHCFLEESDSDESTQVTLSRSQAPRDTAVTVQSARDDRPRQRTSTFTTRLMSHSGFYDDQPAEHDFFFGLAENKHHPDTESKK